MWRWFLREFVNPVTRIVRMLERIMAQIDDLKTALTDISGRVDAVKVEVEDLIARLGQTPPPDLTEVLGIAQSIQAKLAAIPAEPA